MVIFCVRSNQNTTWLTLQDCGNASLLQNWLKHKVVLLIPFCGVQGSIQTILIKNFYISKKLKHYAAIFSNFWKSFLDRRLTFKTATTFISIVDIYPVFQVQNTITFPMFLVNVEIPKFPIPRTSIFSSGYKNSYLENFQYRFA